VLDGVSTCTDEDAAPRFHPLPGPSEEELARFVVRIEKRVLAYLRHRGVLPDDEASTEGPLADDPSLLAPCYAASVAGRIGLGPDSGFRVTREGRIEGMPTVYVPALGCAEVRGFSLHAGERVAARDRPRLERLHPDCDIAGLLRCA